MSTLETLCQGLFDYAGTFPPASLSFDEALKTSASFPYELSRPHLVSVDLVTPAAVLAQIDATLLTQVGVKTGRKFFIAALINELGNDSGKSVSELLAIKAFNASHATGAIAIQVVALEGRLSRASQESPSDLRNLLSQMRDTLGHERTRVFLEIDCSTPQWGKELRSISEVLHSANREPGMVEFGIKVRGGGPSGVDNQKLAETIPVITEFDLAFKATSGLHHPIIEGQRYGDSNKLGFINLTAALMLKRILPDRFDLQSIMDCLNASSTKQFTFDSGRFGFQDFIVSQEQLFSAKKDRHFSIGSCSINEPDDDLVRLFGEPKR